ncbi:MAG TPA: right-handed parallel beta-helix repeat-containing protein, partial [Tepidisphaeraceae bacterium]|nr:right-handed parallel beta-helix repeat-containing protein [Tepidisphaeraceae bacterium]
MKTFFIMASIFFALGAQGREFFVSPTGNDASEGTVQSPFKTLTRARNASREVVRDEIDPIFITLRGGRYELSEPVVFEPQDSGTARSPLVIRAYRDETPILSGGHLVSGWRKVEESNQWSAQLPEPLPKFIRQIWVNRELRHVARHPNSGYLHVAALPDKMPEWDQGQTRFNYRDGDLPTTDLGSAARVVTMTRWVESHLPIASIDPKTHLFNFNARNVFRLDANDPYYIENSRALLDEPGEWFLDEVNRTLYYLPKSGEDMRKAEVIVPDLQQVMILRGDPEKDQVIHNVEFQGITFSHTSWDITFASTTQPSKNVGGFSQASIPVPAAVLGNGVRDCAFERCTFEHIGNWALHLARGCQGNRIGNCDFHDLGAGGIKLGEEGIRERSSEQSFANQITNCTLHDGGNYFHSAVGIWVGQSFNNRIAHNEISDFFYSGISLGWSWGYGPSLNRGNLVEENHVHHIGIKSIHHPTAKNVPGTFLAAREVDGPILSDMGAIYVLGGRDGTVVRRNTFHDIAGIHYGGWGIYLDEGSSNVLVEQNLVYRTAHGGFHLHYGKDNIIRNNIFAFGRVRQIQHSRAEDHRGFIFTRNIVIGDSAMLSGPDTPKSAENDDYDHNLY